jgi:class 3 adenylate cyclase
MRQWLTSLGLEKYVTLFEENEVDFDTLRGLTEKDLADLGLAFGPRRKLLNALASANSEHLLIPVDVVGASRANIGREVTSARESLASADGERRQLTVMFCDLVGSTALSKRLDPESLRTVILDYQRTAAQVITRYEGHVAQYLGDGLLVYFGYPLAHEDDAARAVHTALGIIAALHDWNGQRIHSDLPPLAVRIGIDTGLVVVGEIGGSKRHEPLALGDTPNLAARLQGLAAPDAVVISEHTRRLAGGAFDYLDLGEQLLKGLTAPVHAWKIAGERLVASRFEAATQGALTPMVGRDHEIALLLERWQ